MDPRTQADDEWVDEDPDFLEDEELEDDDFPEDILAPDDEEALDFDDDEPTVSSKSFTARQRVEIAREERWLRDIMADFDEYDVIEDFADEYHAGFSA